MRRLIIFLFLFAPVMISAQVNNTLYTTKTVPVQDSIRLDSVSINPYGFQVFDLHGKRIAPNRYRINFAQAELFPKPRLKTAEDSLRVRFRRYPDFLTQRYFQFRPGRIVKQHRQRQGLYQLGSNHRKKEFTPFSGLNTTGSIARGITAGTNQNSVLNSKLDLQITGKLSDKVSIRASIEDADIPIEQSGYSQNLNEFDQVFIELYGRNWRIRGGDVDLAREDSYFGNFHKKVQGVSLAATLNPDGAATDIFAAGALVRGVFTRNKFKGREGDQGPYKLTGPNGELFALVVSGSESVYVNGVRLKRGEHEDYTIDYNAGEIRFNPTFPITSAMRITVEFQYADRNYSRVIATGGARHHEGDWEIGGFVYSENDLRNQPLQQDLSDAQKQVLADAGDDPTQMVAPSAVPADFSENKVLYRKDSLNGQVIFVYSNNPNDDLYRVKFTLVGAHNGNYILANQTAIAKIYEYVPPENGIPQGKYAPVTRLFAPTKLQMGVINGGYHPSAKTGIDFELAASRHDKNLFSTKDDGDNNGYAGHITAKQNLYTADDTTQINAFAQVDFLQKNFQTIEPLHNVEFNRDWNLQNPEGNQTYIDAGIAYTQPSIGYARYHFQELNYSGDFTGTRQLVDSRLRFGQFTTHLHGSLLNSNSPRFSSQFLRYNLKAVYHFSPFWTGLGLQGENNHQTDKSIDQLTALSQQFNSYEIFAGVGDSTDVYAAIGYKHRLTDSLREAHLQQVTRSSDYYLKSRLIHSAQAQLSVFVNYREMVFTDSLQQKEKTLNARILYRQSVFDNAITLNTTYETSSGTVPQQEYTFVEVDPGKGEYTWIDYNHNGVQELGEFEVASYPDEATYVKVFLPNQIFVKTRRHKFSQIITLNFAQFRKDNTEHPWWGHFFDQTSYLVDRKVKREGNNFNLNPFSHQGDPLSLSMNIRNTLYFNRGKQHYTTAYTFISSKNKNLFSTGLQESFLQSHQLTFDHKLGKSWLFHLKNTLNRSKSQSESFHNRDYKIHGFLIHPKLSYFLTRNTRFDIFYQYNKQQNSIGQREALNQQKLGTSFHFSKGQDYSITGQFNYVYNNFSGNAFSPVAYEMLQGLQPQKNFTWRVLFQKKITDYLDLNLSYSGRKSENAPAIHTGSIQLKAYF